MQHTYTPRYHQRSFICHASAPNTRLRHKPHQGFKLWSSFNHSLTHVILVRVACACVAPKYMYVCMLPHHPRSSSLSHSPVALSTVVLLDLRRFKDLDKGACGCCVENATQIANEARCWGSTRRSSRQRLNLKGQIIPRGGANEFHNFNAMRRMMVSMRKGTPAVLQVF